MLKLEPREADVLPVPAPALTARLGDRLEARRPAILAALARGRLAEAVRLVDRLVLRDGLGLSSREIGALRDAQLALAARRHARGARAAVRAPA
jgi:hypothetical protein